MTISHFFAPACPQGKAGTCEFKRLGTA